MFLDDTACCWNNEQGVHVTPVVESFDSLVIRHCHNWTHERTTANTARGPPPLYNVRPKCGIADSAGSLHE